MPHSAIHVRVCDLMFEVHADVGIRSTAQSLLDPFAIADPNEKAHRPDCRVNLQLPSALKSNRFARRVNVIEQGKDHLVLSVKKATPLVVSAALGVAIFRELARRGGLLLHAAMLSRPGAAYLFAGGSGSGKSTLAANATGFHCVHDDRAALRRMQGRWYAYGLPLTQNQGQPGSPVRTPVSEIFFLSQGRRMVRTRLRSDCAFPKLTENTILGLGEPDLIESTFRAALHLVSEIPFSRLRFGRFSNVTELLQ